MLNDARVASLKFFKDNVCTTRINKEKKNKIKFQVLLKFAQILTEFITVWGFTLRHAAMDDLWNSAARVHTRLEYSYETDLPLVM